MANHILVCPQPASAPGTCEVPAQWQPVDSLVSFADLGVTGPEIATVFAWGFGVVVFFWFLGYCIQVAQGAINKA